MAKIPAAQAGAPSPHLALTGANPSPPAQPQEQRERSTCRGGNKTTTETQGSVAKEEDPKPSNQLYKLQL